MLAACATPLQRGERLYRQGDLRGAIEEWGRIAPESGSWEDAQGRLTEVRGELDQRLVRYEKLAAFSEDQGRLAEAILYYRLALKLDPERPEFLDRVQSLARVLDGALRGERRALEAALSERQFADVRTHAVRLERLDPFDPGVQVAVRRARTEVDFEVTRSLEAGKHYYAHGNRTSARRSFDQVLAIDPANETALGYLAYIGRFDAMASGTTPPPLDVSREDVLAEGHYRSGRAAERADEPFRALAEYEAALRVNPDHASTLRARDALRDRLRGRVEEMYETGKRYFQEEDLQNALQVWRRVLMIDPEHARTRENVARAERMLSRLEEIQTGGS
jgi:tetratricopeptide (TPR) repeat protein